MEEEGARLVVAGVGEVMPMAAATDLLALGDTMITAVHLEEEVVDWRGRGPPPRHRGGRGVGPPRRNPRHGNYLSFL